MWQQPKTDWQIGEFFNIGDYNRIKGNINEIRTQAIVLFPDFDFEEMGSDKTYRDYTFYADEINRFEENLEKICVGTFSFPIGEKKTFSENAPFIQWEELNRIESACLKLYQNFKNGADSRPMLEYMLNGGEF